VEPRVEQCRGGVIADIIAHLICIHHLSHPSPMVRRQPGSKKCHYCNRPLGAGAKKHLEACEKLVSRRRQVQDRNRARMLNKADHRIPRVPTPSAFQ
jgi:hypothetical protein